MLQQTQAARVVPYYHAFLERFPDPPALAAAPAADVLAAWSGLGYNRRALALQRAAARGRRARLAGGPDRAAGRRRLHGGRGRLVRLGRAGGGGRHQRAPRDLPPRRRRARAAARSRARAAELMPAGRAAPFNQAMMELGATVCRPRAARVRRLPGARGLRVGGPRAGAAAAPRGRAARALRGQRPLGARADRRRAGGRRAAARRWPRRAASGPRPGLLRDGLAVRGADGALRLP